MPANTRDSLALQFNLIVGGFEFVPALEYPESEDGAQLREGPKELPSTGNAVDAFSASGVPGVRTVVEHVCLI